MTKIFKTTEISKALSIYQKADIIAFPTDTVYGIGANIFNEEAIKKIYRIKNRPQNKPIAILCANLEQIKMIVEHIPEPISKLINYFLPGPLTVILPKNKIIPNYVTSNLATIGIRIPNHPLSLELLKAIGPLATTSANKSGEDSINNGNEVINEFINDVDIIIDGGITDIGVASTVVAVEHNEVQIIREGSITKAMINSVLKKS